MQHDYASAPDPAIVDLVLEENTSLRDENRLLRQQLERLTLKQRFGIHRFTASDKDIRFFTRFSSYDILMRFWGMLQNALPSMVSVRQAQRGAPMESTALTHTLQPIDEFFLFLNYLALGLKQRDLADRYGIHQSTVSRIISSWSNFLFTVLGSVRIWIPEEEIRRNLPADFRDYPDSGTVTYDAGHLT
uniref:Transposase Helix-turn-helix domain-containing protein n=2 Tax=Nothobranchius kadleci TaxID=1051664 RepID=A0A1A8C358_NOTKA